MEDVYQGFLNYNTFKGKNDTNRRTKKTRFKKSKTLKKAATVFTNHNITFQLGNNWWEVPLNKKDKGQGALPFFNNSDIEYINFAKRGIIYTDIINTVSETYARQILYKSIGQDLHRILKKAYFKSNYLFLY